MTIIIEDKADGKDEKFIRTIYSKYYPDRPIPGILSSSGKDGLQKMRPKLDELRDSMETILIIFDADTPMNNGGFTKRKAEIESIMKQMNIDYYLFLLPDNQSDGDFESIYENIINPKHKILIECFEQYEDCISQEKSPGGECRYMTPNRKSKMYTFITSQKLSNKAREELKNKSNWQFENPEYWDLNSEYLIPLVDFLGKS